MIYSKTCILQKQILHAKKIDKKRACSFVKQKTKTKTLWHACSDLCVLRQNVYLSNNLASFF